jgi:hypothetical protein
MLSQDSFLLEIITNKKLIYLHFFSLNVRKLSTQFMQCTLKKGNFKIFHFLKGPSQKEIFALKWYG